VRDFGLYTLDFSVVGLNEPVLNPGTIKCYPNPFIASTNLSLELEENAEVSYAIHTLQGQLVHRSAHMSMAKGIHNLPVGGELKPGIYLVLVFLDNSAVTTIRLVKTNF
jgi:hypothetical protein